MGRGKEQAFCSDPQGKRDLPSGSQKGCWLDQSGMMTPSTLSIPFEIPPFSGGRWGAFGVWAKAVGWPPAARLDPFPPGGAVPLSV